MKKVVVFVGLLGAVGLCGFAQNSDTGMPYDLKQALITLQKELKVDKMAAEKTDSAQSNSEYEMRKQKAQSCAGKTVSQYKAFKNYPATIQDGWHKVIVTNGNDICTEAKVMVNGNLIVKYFADEYLERDLRYSVPIHDGKTQIKIQYTDGVVSEYFDVYFIDNIANPAATTTPSASGKFSFFTSMEGVGKVEIYLEGYYIGTLLSYFPQGTPKCEQEGTVHFKFKPGTYEFSAKATDGNEWNGQITIAPDDCGILNLTNN